MVKVPEKFGLEKKTKPVPEKVTVSVPVKFDTSTGKFPGIWYRSFWVVPVLLPEKIGHGKEYRYRYRKKVPVPEKIWVSSHSASHSLVFSILQTSIFLT